MSAAIAIGLIGDHDEAVLAHRAIPLALQAAADAAAADVHIEWLATPTISPAGLGRFDGLWCVPASPYRSTEGALRAIRFAREHRVPFLGTCGGFQHAVLEYARHVLGWRDAEHAETAPEAALTVIAPLSCSLVEVHASVRVLPGTQLARAYGTDTVTEGYHCRYGLNPALRGQLLCGALRASAYDEDDEVRAVELVPHPFFVATLFQPERGALAGRPVPLVSALLAACLAARSDAQRAAG